MEKLESDIERKLCIAIRKEGGACLKLINQGKRHFPDRTIGLPGGFIAFAECKRNTKDGVLRTGQKRWRRILQKRLGFPYFTVRTQADINKILVAYRRYYDKHCADR